MLGCSKAADALDYFKDDLVSALTVQQVADLLTRRTDFADNADVVRRQLLALADEPRTPSKPRSLPSQMDAVRTPSAVGSYAMLGTLSMPPPGSARKAPRTPSADADDDAHKRSAVPLSAPPRSAESRVAGASAAAVAATPTSPSILPSAPKLPPTPDVLQTPTTPAQSNGASLFDDSASTFTPVKLDFEDGGAHWWDSAQQDSADDDLPDGGSAWASLQ